MDRKREKLLPFDTFVSYSDVLNLTFAKLQNLLPNALFRAAIDHLELFLMQIKLFHSISFHFLLARTLDFVNIWLATEKKSYYIFELCSATAAAAKKSKTKRNEKMNRYRLLLSDASIIRSDIELFYKPFPFDLYHQ